MYNRKKQVSVTHHTLPKRIEYLEELRLVDLGFQMMWTLPISKIFTPLHHKAVCFPNRPLYIQYWDPLSGPQQSPGTWLSSSPTQTMRSGMFGAGHENPTLLTICCRYLHPHDGPPSHDPPMQPRSLPEAACGSTSFPGASASSDIPPNRLQSLPSRPQSGRGPGATRRGSNRSSTSFSYCNRERLRTPPWAFDRDPKILQLSSRTSECPGYKVHQVHHTKESTSLPRTRSPYSSPPSPPAERKGILTTKPWLFLDVILTI